ncbi:MAG TPA: patatin-like phospholipase family protein, partial [Thermoanaerobaculia bacterium]|nr:patatin-like phospholipase family protein [Thermoanaerobaculia bacterium]
MDSLQPTVANRLVGLALSGGGPRSAVFNLGVLQALYRHGVFRHVDYLSTVSGGGYIGSTLLNLLSEGGREFPFAAGPRGEEAPLVSWLRNQSVHLAPRRFLDYGLRAAVFLQGILLNFLALTPLLLLVAVGVAERFNQLTSGDTVLARWELIKKAYLVAPISLVVSIAFLAVWSFFHRRLRISRALIGTATRSTIGSRNANRTVWAVVLFVNSVSLIFETLLILLQEFHLAASGPVARGAFLLTLSAVSIAALAAAGPLLGNRLGRWRKAIGVALLACWPVAPLALVFYVAHGLVYSWPPLWQMSSPKAWFPASVLWIPTAWLMANSSVVITDPIFSRAGSSRVQALLSTLMGLFAVVAAGALVLELKVWWMGDTPVRFILVLIAVLFLLVWTVYDANASSTFWFFRDLQRTAFLVKMAGDPPKEVSVFTDPDPRPLAEDHKSGSAAAPYHLINTSLNLHGSDDPSLGDRIHDGFLLSKHVYGSSRTGYWRTRDLEAVFPSMDLATATAASATSTAPNFVNTSSQLLSSLLSLLNLRPGYWLPNPRQLARFAGRRTGSVEGSLWNRGVWKVGLEAYFLEIKGKLTDDQRWVNVADGGYFDNLALYELLRRRCRYIVVSDAGADPEMSRGGLARLTRLARAELGIEIELDLEALTPKGSSPSRHHAAVGVIQYPPFDQGDSPEKGLLLYLKPALTGDENRMITEYATRQPAFPHEGRADRFLGEGQFDAYKDLGFHSVDGLFDPVGPGESAFQLDRKDFFEWLETLGSKLSPKSEAAGGAAGAEGEAREPDRRRDQQRNEE